MKTNLTLVLAVIAVITTTNLQQANAQNWNLAGNNNATANSKLGTKNAVPLRLFTNNSERVLITTPGNVGIGTFTPFATPSKHLHVKGAGDQEIGIESTDGNAHLWTLQSNGTGVVPSTFQIIDRTSSVSRLGITNSGNVGIGTTDPSKHLHINGAGDQEIGIQSTDANAHLWTLQSSGTSVVPTTFQIIDRTLGVSRFGITNDGNVGIGTSPAAGYTLTINGSGLASGGMWQNSDQKLKQNVVELSSAMAIIKQLKPKTYYFKTTQYPQLNLPTKKQYGFIAQEMEKVLPDLVNTSAQAVRMDTKGKAQMEDIKAVNYPELIPVLTQAIKEQQNEIDELKQMVEKLSALVANHELTRSSGLIMSNATLEQNIPNPTRGSAIVRYSIPGGAKIAQLVVADFAGRSIKQVTIPTAGSGEINIDASTLSSGTYTYSLVVDGKVIISRTMVVAK